MTACSCGAQAVTTTTRATVRDGDGWRPDPIDVCKPCADKAWEGREEARAS